MRRRWHLLRGCGGAEIAEFAIVLPILLMVMFAVYSFGRAYNIYTTITRAAQEGAQIAAMPSTCGTCPTAGAAPCGGGPATTYPAAGCVGSTVSAILQASHIDPAQIQTFGPNPPMGAALVNCAVAVPPPLTDCSAPTIVNNIKVCGAVLNSGSTGPQECGVIVSFQYPYQMLPMLNLGTISLKVQAETRLE